MNWRSLLVVFVFPLGFIYGAAVEFLETFDGSGPFESSNGIIGFDNPDWFYSGDGTFENSGLMIRNVANEPGVEFDSIDSDLLERAITREGDFVETIRFSDYLFEPTNSGTSLISMQNRVIGSRGVFMTLTQQIGGEDPFELILIAGETVESHVVASGPHIELNVRFDADTQQVFFAYDNNMTDEVPAMQFGPIDYVGEFSRVTKTSVMVVAEDGAARTDALLDFWSFVFPDAPLPGDFNGNEMFDVFDVDLLIAEISAGTNNLDFDLVMDGSVDEFDLNHWVHQLRRTFFGDANLDGEFNSSDLVHLFQEGEYEDEIEGNSTWSTGDWNADGEFTSRDLVFAFGDGGYEVGPQVGAVHAVPEQSTLTIVFLPLVILMWQLNKRSY